MKRHLYILFFTLLPVLVAAGGSIQQPAVADTSSPDTLDTRLIEEVLQTRTLPKKEKVHYVTQVTRYGFRNLFSQYAYNSTLPYAAQVNPQAELFVQDYMRRHAGHLNKMKGWGQPYFNLIESVLLQYGLPRELKYIAVIESNLSTAATSHKGAGGPWQFMPHTAREYGLQVLPYNDERRDYYKSTHAAARYLLNLYRDLKDWLLVMAAYNGGPGRVYSAIKKSGSRNFWNLQYYLPEESRTYVKRFIATHYIMEGGGGVTTRGNSAQPAPLLQAGKSAPVQKEQLSETELETVEMLPVSGRFNSLVIAKNLSMDITAFNRYNPEFDSRLATAGQYEMRLPPDKMQLFVANKYNILNECVQVLLGEVTAPVNRTAYPQQRGRKKNT